MQIRADFCLIYNTGWQKSLLHVLSVHLYVSQVLLTCRAFVSSYALIFSMSWLSLGAQFKLGMEIIHLLQRLSAGNSVHMRCLGRLCIVGCLAFCILTSLKLIPETSRLKLKQACFANISVWGLPTCTHSHLWF